MKQKRLNARVLTLIVIPVVFCIMILSSCTKKSKISKEFPIIKKAADFELVNQDNEKIRLNNFPGKVKVMSFIYVKCPMPNACPLTIKNFRRIQELLEEYNEDVVFLIITFDPESDTPGVLKKYGELYWVDFENWHFLTGSEHTIDKVCDDYEIIHERQENGTIRHTVVTLLIDQKNNVRKMYFVNEWKPEDIQKDIIKILDKKG